LKRVDLPRVIDQSLAPAGINQRGCEQSEYLELSYPSLGDGLKSGGVGSLVQHKVGPKEIERWFAPEVG
jgi:hypothetical protein